MSHISISGCKVSDGGCDGIGIIGDHILIEDTEVCGVAGTALHIRGGRHRSLTRARNIVRRNYLHHFARWFRTYRPGIDWGGVGMLFEDNHVAFALHAAFIGGGSTAACGIRLDNLTGAFEENDLPTSADEVGCGANDNVFHGNVIERTNFETTDAGAFYSCGQAGTGRVNKGNIFTNNTLRHIRMLDKGMQGSQPDVQAAYLDDGMSGWTVSNNTIEDCLVGIKINGGSDNRLESNTFENVSKPFFPVNACDDNLTYLNLRVVSKWPAWQKYMAQTPAMVVPPTLAVFHKLSCKAVNMFKNSTCYTAGACKQC
eukprot:SAG11_NODE_4493_length_1875_cov_1.686374_1_plen_314_part_00